MIFQDLQDLIETCQEGNPEIERFDTSVFNGDYITGGIDEAYLKRLDDLRNDLAKGGASTVSVIEDVDDDDDSDSNIELHNVGGS